MLVNSITTSCLGLISFLQERGNPLASVYRKCEISWQERLFKYTSTIITFQIDFQTALGLFAWRLRFLCASPRLRKQHALPLSFDQLRELSSPVDIYRPSLPPPRSGLSTNMSESSTEAHSWTEAATKQAPALHLIRNQSVI